MVNYYSPLKK